MYLFFLDKKKNIIMHNMSYFTFLLNLNGNSLSVQQTSLILYNICMDLHYWKNQRLLNKSINGFQVFFVAKNALDILEDFCQYIFKANS